MELSHEPTPEEAFLDYIEQGSPFSRRNGITIRLIEKGVAEGEVALAEERTNMFGGLHGGVYFTLADCTAGLAAMSVTGCACSTLESTLHFLTPPQAGTLKAAARVVHAGNRTVVCNVALSTEDGKRCAQATLVYCPYRGHEWEIPNG